MKELMAWINRWWDRWMSKLCVARWPKRNISKLWFRHRIKIISKNILMKVSTKVKMKKMRMTNSLKWWVNINYTRTMTMKVKIWWEKEKTMTTTWMRECKASNKSTMNSRHTWTWMMLTMMTNSTVNKSTWTDRVNSKSSMMSWEKKWRAKRLIKNLMKTSREKYWGNKCNTPTTVLNTTKSMKTRWTMGLEKRMKIRFRLLTSK